MKRNLVDFTRGSQLLGHFGFMFAAGLKGPLILGILVISWVSWAVLSAGLSDHETYLIWMRIYAAAYGFMEFDPHKDIALKTIFGNTINLPMSAVQDFPPVARAWDHLIALEKRALVRSALLIVPSFFLFYWFASYFGRKSKERKHERGSELVTLSQLTDEILENNREERANELTELMGWKWRLCAPSELKRVLPYTPSSIAGVPYPWRLEQSHAMLIGTTGMGKTVVMSDLVAQARAKRQRAIVFDLTGAFIEHFYDAERDVILNPLDARCPQWSVFDECRDEAEFTAAAAALVPHDGGGSEQFWVLAARLLFVEMCLKLRANGRATNDALASELMTADLAAVHRLMRGTVADPLTAPEAARMAESIRAVFNANAKALKLLPKTGPYFSIRDWVEEDQHDGGFVFISARYVDMSVCSQLLTVWLDLAMNTLMALERTRDLKMWFFVDELGALHRLPALEKGLQTARNFGGAIVTGAHAYAKLKDVYGDNMAMTLSSLARTKLILGTADADTSKWCSDFIGHSEIRNMEEGYTYGYNNARDAVSLTQKKTVQPLVLPSQLGDLKRLRGYLKFPDGFPAAPVVLRPVNRPTRAVGFIHRHDAPATEAIEAPAAQAAPVAVSQPVAPKPGEAPAEHPSSNDDGAGRRVVPAQGELSLEPKDRQESDGARDKDVAKSPANDPALNPSEKAPEKTQTGPDGRPAMDSQAVLRASGETSPDGKSDGNPTGTVPPKVPLIPDSNAPDAAEPPGEDARRLMLEDGAREDEVPPPPEIDLGDPDIDI